MAVELLGWLGIFLGGSGQQDVQRVVGLGVMDKEWQGRTLGKGSWSAQHTYRMENNHEDRLSEQWRQKTGENIGGMEYGTKIDFLSNRYVSDDKRKPPLIVFQVLNPWKWLVPIYLRI